MKKSLFLLLTLLGALAGYSQFQPKDSLYYVRLRDGSVLYSRKVDLVNSFMRGKYLRLDSNRIIPLGDAKDFKGWDGTYAVGNPNGVYNAFRLEKEGPRISLYSKCYYSTETVYASTTPGGPQFPTTITTREKAFYFRKNDSDVQRLTYNNLRLAVTDNPAATHEVRIAGTNLYLGIGLAAAGVGLLVAGIIQTNQRNNDAQNAFSAASEAWYNQNNPNAPPPTLPHYGLSSLFWIGTAMSFSAMIPLFNVHQHVNKALLIYNGID